MTDNEMTEALGVVIAFLFNDVKCNRIEARYDTNNPHSGEVIICSPFDRMRV